MNTPASQGYRMPAEWEPHAAVWLSWPKPDGISFPERYELIPPVLAEMVGALAESEAVHINVCDPAEEALVRAHLQRVPHAHVRFYHIPTNEPWCRDHGPIFLMRDAAPRRAIVDWGYNAWGGKYPPYHLDDVVPTKIAALYNIPLFQNAMVLEGGSIEVNGEGLLLTTESCLLNPNRNPCLDKTAIEANLRDYLGVHEIFWLGDGIEGDDTDGHIDDITRFVGRRKVVTVIEPDPKDFNYAPLKENLERLQALRCADGGALEIITLPMPGRVEWDGQRLPASYANFYIGNTVVLVPIFGDPADVEAVATLQACFPDRKAIGINCRDLIWGLGAFHCLSQQEPA